MVGIPFLHKKEPKPTGKGIVPVDRVKELASKGFAEPEIIDVLRREGYSAEETDKALTQVLKLGVTAPPTPESVPSPKNESPITLEELQREEPEKQQQAAQSQIPETSLPEQYYQTYPTEEYIDYVVRERMGELKHKIGEFAIRYEEVNKRIQAIQEQLGQLSQTKASEQQILGSKIDNFSETVGDVDTRLGSLEKAFKETLPALIESVRALSDLVGRMKREA